MPLPLNVGVGVSKSSPEEALEEASEDLSNIDVVLCAFSTDHDPHDVHEAVSEYLSDEECLILGVSSAGNITPDGFSDRSVAILAMEMSKLVAMGAAVGTNFSENPYEVAREAVKRAIGSVNVDVSAALAPVATEIVVGNTNVARHSPVDVILFADGLCCLRRPDSATEALRGVLDELGTIPRIVGGMTADRYEMEHTYVFDNSGVYEDALAVLVVFSSVKRGHAVAHGFTPISEPMLAKVDSVDVLELDGEPALETYSDVVGEEVNLDTLFRFPLGVKDVGPHPYYLIRTPVDTDEERNALTLASPLPDGVAVQVMGPDNLKKSIKRAVERALKDAGSPEKLGAVIVINCASRHLVIDTEEEVEFLVELVGEDVPVFGFNSYGEYGQTPSGKVVHLNQTVSTYVLGNEVV